MKVYKTYKLILTTPLIVDIPSSYYHRQDYHFHNQYYQKILPNSGTSPLGLTLQCNVWSGEEKIERKPYIQPAAVVRSAFGYEEFYRNSEIQSWKKEHQPLSIWYHCLWYSSACLPWTKFGIWTRFLVLYHTRPCTSFFATNIQNIYKHPNQQHLLLFAMLLWGWGTGNWHAVYRQVGAGPI